MKKPKPIPLSAAKEISNLGYDEVIVVGANYETGTQHVTTYGKTVPACENAALGGNAIKKLLKWPEEKCNAKPKRQIKRERYEAMEEICNILIDTANNPLPTDQLNYAKLIGVAVLAKKKIIK